MEKNNEVYFGNAYNYINSLFSEAKRKELKWLQSKSLWVDEDLHLCTNDATELQEEYLKAFDFAWREYERLYMERNDK